MAHAVSSAHAAAPSTQQQQQQQREEQQQLSATLHPHLVPSRLASSCASITTLMACVQYCKPVDSTVHHARHSPSLAHHPAIQHITFSVNLSNIMVVLSANRAPRFVLPFACCTAAEKVRAEVLGERTMPPARNPVKVCRVMHCGACTALAARIVRLAPRVEAKARP